MKSAIHPELHADAKTTCSTCSMVFEIPSTEKEMTVERCRNCHPIYTGKVQEQATGGRVERFQKRMAAQKAKDASA